jgi:two-component system, cell cycle response regulator DivK
VGAAAGAKDLRADREICAVIRAQLPRSRKTSTEDDTNSRGYRFARRADFFDEDLCLLPSALRLRPRLLDFTYPMTTNGRRVLVVEDNDMNMQLVEYLLEEGGMVIVKATSGEEALRITREADPFDLILMDIHLPGMDGLSVVRAMKDDQRTANVPILALTAHAMRGDKDRFLDAGCDGYISKPIDVKTFLSSIETYLR